MKVIMHKGCNAPAIESDSVIAETCAIPVASFPFPCFSCLEEIEDESELRITEEIGM